MATAIAPLFSLSLFAGALYACGIAFDHGYLSSFGIDPGLFPRKTEDNYVRTYYGLILLYPDLMKALPALLTAVVVFIVIIIFAGSNGDEDKEYPEESWQKKIAKHRLFKPALYSFILSAAVWVISSVLVLMGLLLLSLPRSFYFEGKELGSEQREKHTQCLLPKDGIPECSYLFNDQGFLGAGEIVAADTVRVALFDGGRTRVYLLDGLRVETIPAAAKGKEAPEKPAS
jgi:hypothetical protein